MGILSNLVNTNSSEKYTELTNADIETQDADNNISFVDVKQKQDIMNAKDALQKGTIVILDVSLIESNGLSLDMVYGNIQSEVEVIGGDIIHKSNNDIIIATPNNTAISRQKI